MATNQEKSFPELIDKLGSLLAERERLLEESLPPQLRKVRALESGPCEATRFFPLDFTGEDGVPCGADGVERPECDHLILCNHCFKAVC